MDDDDGMREAIESLLGAAGFAAIAYPSAEAFFAGRAAEGASCVISDLKLPGMSGLELLSQLRVSGASAPVIVITAHDTPGVRKEAEQHRAAAYLAKPFQASALLAAIERVTKPVSSQ